jgi:hypothetical protein
MALTAPNAAELRRSAAGGVPVSLGLMVYLVPTDEVIGVIGCQNEDLLADVLERMADDIESLDEQFDTDSEEFGPGLTFAQALEELFVGSLSRPEACDFVYTYAFEEVCRYYGEWLGNTRFARCSTDWLDHLDGLLSRGSVPLRFHDLVYRCPVERLPYQQVLGLGHWKRSEALRARRPLERLLPTLRDEAEWLALEEAGRWLEAASGQPRSMVVGVLS